MGDVAEKTAEKVIAIAPTEKPMVQLPPLPLPTVTVADLMDSSDLPPKNTNISDKDKDNKDRHSPPDSPTTRSNQSKPSRRLSLSAGSTPATTRTTNHRSSASSSAGLVPSPPSLAALKHEVVFVDPDDAEAPWWWPAIVVPPNEFQEFRKSYNLEIDEPKEGEYLVCYFEDGSFSTIPIAAAMPFNPRSHPYTSYLHGAYANNFKRDNAVRLATDYFENGAIPPSFSWLNGGLAAAAAAAAAAASTRGGSLGDHPDLNLQQQHQPQHSKKGGRGGTNQNADNSSTTTSKRGSGGGSKRGGGDQAESGMTSYAIKKARKEQMLQNTNSNNSGDKGRKQSPPSTSASVSSRSKSIINNANNNVVGASPINQRKAGSRGIAASEKHEFVRESSSVEPSPGHIHSRKLSSATLFGSMYSGKRGSKGEAGIGTKPPSVSPPRGVGPPVASTPIVASHHRSSSHRHHQQQQPQQQQQQQQIPSQIIAGSNYGAPICPTCGKPIGTCMCGAASGPSNATAEQFFQPQQHQTLAPSTLPNIHQVGTLHYTATTIPQFLQQQQQQLAGATTPQTRYLPTTVPSSFSLAAATTASVVASNTIPVATSSMGYYTQQPVVATFDAASAAASSAAAASNPFAPICVLKRSERPEFVMLKDLVPGSRRKALIACLSKRVGPTAVGFSRLAISNVKATDVDGGASVSAGVAIVGKEQ
ncbi:UNVERIFIED_CONTAM: hypothetical protein HDU68_000463 [Siphonaria sp. JEL0065]|nr:hypothetical protein HDU68_000463 [Siphonaria sp. JEL0065]